MMHQRSVCILGVCACASCYALPTCSYPYIHYSMRGYGTNEELPPFPPGWLYLLYIHTTTWMVVLCWCMCCPALATPTTTKDTTNGVAGTSVGCCGTLLPTTNTQQRSNQRSGIPSCWLVLVCTAGPPTNTYSTQMEALPSSRV
jgi:hypothetical protein